MNPQTETHFEITKTSKTKFDWKIENYNAHVAQSFTVELSDEMNL